MNKLFYGDNLDVLRDHIASESVDLIYLDPPFNSNANYNILFKSKTGDGSDAQIEAFDSLGELYISPSGRPKYKQRPTTGVALQDIWAFQPGTEGALYGSSLAIDSDVKWLSNEAEKLGYPTQKPLGLLERIIAASSNEGDIVLDPFCGCGTAVHAAQKLGREWIGIDVTHLAISLIEKRMKDAFPGIEFTVEGTPKDLASAQDLAERDKYTSSSGGPCRWSTRSPSAARRRAPTAASTASSTSSPTASAPRKR